MNREKQPITFNSAMLQAILNGHKTQTRRVIKPQPDHATLPLRCPYGILGDLLDVREKEVGTRIIQATHEATHEVLPIKLEIISIRVEHLQDISEDDRDAEGLDSYKEFSNYGSDGSCDVIEWYLNYQTGDTKGFADDSLSSFRSLWESIYGDTTREWKTNPLVWVIEFKQKEEEIER